MELDRDDNGVVATVTWPLGGGRASTYTPSLVRDLIWEHCGTTGIAVFFTTDWMAIRQSDGPDVVLLAGDTFRIAAGVVQRGA